MSSSKAAIAIVAVLCCFLQVQSDISVRSKQYIYTHKFLHGRQYFGQRSLLFTLCSRGSNAATKLCKITFERDVFDETLPKRVCEIPIISQVPNPYMFEVLEVNFWGEDKAILSWREKSMGSSQTEQITLRTVSLITCDSADYTFDVTSRIGRRYRIFITPSFNSYEVSFHNENRCRNKFCKVTVNEQSEDTDPEPWFPIADSMYNLEPLENDPSGGKLVITVADSGTNRVTISLWRKSTSTKLIEYNKIRALGWSAANGIISICDPDKCQQFNQRGKVIATIALDAGLQPREYLATYNLANLEILAVVCENWDMIDTTNDYYRITLIGRNGRRGRSIDLTDLNCSNKPTFAHMEFFQNTYTNVCLTLFHFTDYPLPQKRSKFTEFCFTLDDFFI